MRVNTRPPDAVPVLSAGKHRNPRKGGCFMEFASFLAGERWSDHPRCTHVLLAGLARQVNDQLTDDYRHRIVPLIPDVVGLNSDDPALDLVIALRAAESALPVASFEQQRGLAVALLRCQHELSRYDDPATRRRLARCSAALRDAPHAAQWAVKFADRPWAGRRQDFARTAPHVVHMAVTSIAQSLASDVDERLCRLLQTAIADCREHLGGHDGSTDTTWAPARPDVGEFPSHASSPGHERSSERCTSGTASLCSTPGSAHPLSPSATSTESTSATVM